MATAREVINGLLVFEKYMDLDSHATVSAAHDRIYSGPGERGSLDEGYTPPTEYMDDEDLEILDELGWFYNEEFGCFMKYV